MTTTRQSAKPFTIVLQIVVALLWVGVCLLKIRHGQGPQADPYSFYPAVVAATGFFLSGMFYAVSWKQQRTIRTKEL